MTIQVFVADDLPDIRWAIIDSLAQVEDFQVVPAEARKREIAYGMPRQIEPTLDLIFRVLPNVVVMDIGWPSDRNAGIRASRQIKERLPATHVLLYSQYVEADLVLQAVLEGGVDGYVSKAEYPSTMLPVAIRTIHQGLPYFVPEVVDRLLKIVRKDVTPPVIDKLLVALRAAEASTHPAGQRLSVTETDVLKRMARGESNRAIARHLHLSEATVKGCVHSIYDKLGAREVTGASGDVEPRVMALLIGVQRGYVAAADLVPSPCV